jgi:hypothetical protein
MLIIQYGAGAETRCRRYAVRWDAAEGSSGTTGMKCLPANSRGGAWDADLSTAPLKGVAIGFQDLFRGRNPGAVWEMSDYRTISRAADRQFKVEFCGKRLYWSLFSKAGLLDDDLPIVRCVRVKRLRQVIIGMDYVG